MFETLLPHDVDLYYETHAAPVALIGCRNSSTGPSRESRLRAMREIVAV